MSYTVDNAIILAAGTASRFAPLSYEKPKALFDVKGEILIERQIRQLKEAGIPEIIVVIGYRQEEMRYLASLFGVKLVVNEEYLTRNNNGSIYAVREYLGNSYICSSDNYFMENPFEMETDDAYYAAVYAEGPTDEWCIKEGADGYIRGVQIGGTDSWYMMGHVFWNMEFSKKFLKILEEEYDYPGMREQLWESFYLRHIDELKLKIRKYEKNSIYEFDTLDELRLFDSSYINNTRSEILKRIAREIKCAEKDIVDVRALKGAGNEAVGFTFNIGQNVYEYSYDNGSFVKK